jgi:hypothetical protein
LRLRSLRLLQLQLEKKRKTRSLQFFAHSFRRMSRGHNFFQLQLGKKRYARSLQFSFVSQNVARA